MILHILLDEKFTNSFVEFINKEFSSSEHLFMVMCSKKQLTHVTVDKIYDNVIVMHKNFQWLFTCIRLMKTSDKIILHGMFTRYIVYILACFSLADKTMWCVWGGDLYDYAKEGTIWKKIKTAVISRLKGIITQIYGDYELACKEYNASCKWFPAQYMQITNKTVKTAGVKKTEKGDIDAVSILVGNSADPSNNHQYILDKLIPYKMRNINIYIPLSYGDQIYAEVVAKYAKSVFGEKVHILNTFMPLEEYNEFLANIDIAIFAHDRQQAVNNIISLILTGTKVYLKRAVTTWKWLESIGVKVFDTEAIDKTLLIPLCRQEQQDNVANMLKVIDEERIKNEWENVFEY